MHAEFIPLTPLSKGALEANGQQEIAVYDGNIIDRARFTADVKTQMSLFSGHKFPRYALYYQEAYPFCVSLFALLHCNKNVWIAGNNKKATAERLIKLGCQLHGEWPDQELIPPTHDVELQKLKALNLDAEITIFTSGSSGEAKPIKKSLQQLQNEIEVLEQQWGSILGQQVQVLATVSHQHIYGLLFRVLWSLTSGRCFHSQMYLSPESVIKAAKDDPAVWIASPAQLKRLDEMTLWQELTKLRAIFCSGGALSIEAVTQIYQRCGHKVIEVYGSSETGGVAWRQLIDNELWKAFDGINIKKDVAGRKRLFSPFLADPTGHLLDDKIECYENGRFALLGRIDRIVKVEEKRLSLDELESFLNDSEWVEQSYTLLLSDLISKKREKIAAVLVLTESGKQYLQQQGRAALIKKLRKHLSLGFDSVVLPRKWMFIESLPLTTQGKIDHELLWQLNSLDSTLFPQIQGCRVGVDSVLLQFCVQAEIVYFSGHFPGLPILPGVAQIAWVEKFGKIFFNIKQPFLRMEVIKFKKKITPGKIIQMHLNWKASNNKLYFEFISSSDSHSSGRMVYGEEH